MTDTGGPAADAACIQPEQLPSFPKLAAHFVSEPARVATFYPHSPDAGQLPGTAPKQAQYPSERRRQVATILQAQNESWAASPQVSKNLIRFRDGAVTMVTGQQVALWGGPLYAVYKALTAIKFAKQLTHSGIECVPVFWLATEDHDFAEVSRATLFSSSRGLVQVDLESTAGPNRPVSAIKLGEAITPLLQQAEDVLGKNEVTSLLRACYRPQETLGSAFAKLFSNIFSKYGLIILDPADPEFHRLASPLYKSALEKSDRLVQLLLERGSQLEAAGYEPQVKVTASSTLLFRMRNGERLPVRRVNGAFVAGTEKLSALQMAQEIVAHPENFSPNVLLRPVVQDFLLPTVAYVGGPSEIAYFAQANVVYQELLGRVTPVLPRFSATLIDPKSRRILEQYGITVSQVLEGPEHVRERLAQRNLPQELDAALEQARRLLEQNLASIVAQLKKLDPTLVDAAETSVAKMEYQLDHLRKKAAHAQLRRREELGRHADHLSACIYPNKNLQEREIAAVSFLAQHGPSLLDRIYEAIQPACLGHHLLHI